MRWRGLALAALTAVTFGSASTPPPTLAPVGVEPPTLVERYRIRKAHWQEQREQSRLWKDVFTRTDSKHILFFDKDGSTIGVCDKRRAWPRGCTDVTPQLDSLLERSGRGWWQTRAKRVMRLARQSAKNDHAYADMTWNSGRNDHLRALGKNASFLSMDTRIYNDFSLPGELAAQIVLESGTDATAHSWAAHGVAQLSFGNDAYFRSALPFVYEWKDRFTPVAIAASMLQVLAKEHGSVIMALQAYHSGDINARRIESLGRMAGVSGTPFAQYLAGLEIRRSYPNSRKYRRIFSPSMGPATLTYVDQVLSLTSLLDSTLAATPQDSVYRYITTRRWSVRELERSTGLSKEILQWYNPNLYRHISKNSAVYLPKKAAVGRLMPFSDDPQCVQDAWHAWRKTTLEWKPQYIPAWEAFQHWFGCGGERGTGPFMAAAIGWAVSTIRVTFAEHGDNESPAQRLQAYATDTVKQALVRRARDPR